jgi:uncharacterized membrane protein
MKTRSSSLPALAVSHRVALGGLAVGAALLIGFRDQIARAAAGGISPHAPDLALIAHQSLGVRIHILAAVTALLIALFLLSGAKGTRMHRTVGWIWSAAMMTTALSSFLIMELNRGQLSWIHLLSGWTAFATPLGVWAARTHRVSLHRRTMTRLVVGGLLIAGLFTFVPGRLMWRVFFG